MNNQFATNNSAIPEILKHLNTVAVALLNHDGTLLDANDGFLNLLNKPGLHGNIKQFFINPKFEYLANSYPSNNSETIIFNGIVTLGDPDKKTDSLQVAVFRFQNKILLIGEHDIGDSIRLNGTVMELNKEMSQMQYLLIKTNDQLQRGETLFNYLTLTDPLTGIGNRHFFIERAAVEIARSIRYNTQLALISFAVDHLNEINDTYGLDAGDSVIKQISQTIVKPIRKIDIAARIGGVEFLILLPETTLDQATIVAERIKSALETTVFDNINRNMTASFGVVQHTDEKCIDDLIKKAGTAVYRSKNDGGNKVTVG